MTTPELNNFISQARAAGQTDEQIRQSLTNQGWQEADISSALNPSASSALPAAAASSSWVGVGILLVVIAGMAIYVSYNFRGNDNSSNGQQNNNPFAAGQNNKNRQCGNWNELTKDGDFGIYNESEQYFPSDFHLPSGLRHLGTLGGQNEPQIITDPDGAQSVKLYGMYYYCSSQSVDDVSKYILANSPAWNIKNNADFRAPDTSSIASIDAQKKANGMTYSLEIGVMDTQGSTLIFVGYTGYK